MEVLGTFRIIHIFILVIMLCIIFMSGLYIGDKATSSTLDKYAFICSGLILISVGIIIGVGI